MTIHYQSHIVAIDTANYRDEQVIPLIISHATYTHFILLSLA